jgi:hypothetical protein
MNTPLLVSRQTHVDGPSLLGIQEQVKSEVLKREAALLISELRKVACSNGCTCNTDIAGLFEIARCYHLGRPGVKVHNAVLYRRTAILLSVSVFPDPERFEVQITKASLKKCASIERPIRL